MEVYDLEVLLTVGEAGGFRKAGLKMGIGQSAVTRRIRKLEDTLGVSLLERSAAGARLTAAGWNFASGGRRLINDLQHVIHAAQCAGRAVNGRLRLGLIASLSRGALRQVVSDFNDRHPEIDLTFTEADRGELLTLLSHRDLDVVFAAGARPSEHVDMLLLTEEQLYLAVPCQCPLARRSRVSWRDVESLNFIVASEEPGPEIRDYILRKVSNLGRQANVRQHRMEREGIMSLVGMGFGVSLMCEHWRGVRYPNVSFVPLGEEDENECIPFSLSWRPENDNPALRRFLSLAREVAKTAATSSEP